MKDELNGLFQKKMDRLTFLKHVGVGFIAITGFSTLVKTLGGLGTTPRQTASTGYGSSPYGGNPLSR